LILLTYTSALKCIQSISNRKETALFIYIFNIVDGAIMVDFAKLYLLEGKGIVSYQSAAILVAMIWLESHFFVFISVYRSSEQYEQILTCFDKACQTMDLHMVQDSSAKRRI